jgi:DNA mismatch repair protein MutL
VTWGAAAGGDELARLGDVLGPDFRANAVAINAEREGVRVTGFAGLPTLSRANSLGQYLFVNGRAVRDKLLFGAVRAAYADYLPRDRHPVLALFVSLDPREVDVNVHPAKTEVRFRDGALMRGLIVRALKDALMREGQRAATTGGSATIATFRPAAVARRGSYDWRRSPARPSGFAPMRGPAAGLAEAARLQRYRRSGRGCLAFELRARRRSGRPAARGCARTAARNLHCRPDTRRACDRRPARRARAHRL